ncbi:hypothetical protein CCP3SC1AL1_770011 [Gammaproteobacteria bacterium]
MGRRAGLLGGGGRHDYEEQTSVPTDRAEAERRGGTLLRHQRPTAGHCQPGKLADAGMPGRTAVPGGRCDL